MPTVNQYEVELLIGKKVGGGERQVTMTEYAYGILDAMQQAGMHVFPTLKTDEEVKRISRIGPPADLILAASNQMNQLIEDTMKTLGKNSRKGKRTLKGED